MERALPFDHEFEKALIGRCLIDTDSLLYAFSTVMGDYFTHPFYGAVWAAMEGIHKDGLSIDILQVKQRVCASIKESPMDTGKKLAELNNNMPLANVESWVRYLRDLRNRRAFINLCDDYADQAAVCPMGDFADSFHVDYLGITQDDTDTVTDHQRIDNAIKKIESGMNNSGISGVPVGLEPIDLVTGGWQPGLHVFAGRPGNGKTEFACFMADYISRTTPAYFAQLEMSENQSTFRQFTAASGIRYSKMQRNQISSFELSQLKTFAQELKSRKLYMDATAGMSCAQIVGKLKYHKKKHGIQIAFIDYVQIMDVKQAKNETRDQAIGNVTRMLKKAANELELPIILLAQLSRATDARPFGRPVLGDLRESGNIENDADTVILLYYAENYREAFKNGFVSESTNHPLDEVVEFIWAKNRAGTPNLSTFAKWQRGTVKYTDVPEMNINLKPQHEQVAAF